MSKSRPIQRHATIALVLATLLGESARGDEIAIVNPGFEQPPLADREWTTMSVPGWSLLDLNGLLGVGIGDSGVYNPPVVAYEGEAPGGQNVGYVFLMSPVGAGEVAISQTLSTTVTAGVRYTLRVDVGDPNDYDGFQMTGFPGYRVELRAGGVLLTADDNSLLIREGSFETSFVAFTTPAGHDSIGKALEIRLVNKLQDSGREVDFDNVRLDAEELPATFRRGDCNDDGTVDISDGVCILNWLFLGGPTPGCQPVTNINGDDETNVADPSFLFNFLFLGGPPPAAPFPDCGTSNLPVDEALGCAEPPAHCS